MTLGLLGEARLTPASNAHAAITRPKRLLTHPAVADGAARTSF